MKRNNKKINVLDYGFVELVDIMGDDYRILQSARVSTGGSASKGDEQDKNLIRYLYVNNHLSPFEQVVLTFHVKMPIFVARQWMRHRTFSYNEYSLRYSEAINDIFTPTNFRIQGKTNHQGSGVEIDGEVNEIIKSSYKEAVDKSFSTYDYMLENGVAREMARGILPVSQYTEMYMTVNLRNLFHFLHLRLHEHSQYEIRVYAQAILDILNSIYGLKYTMEIFNEVNEVQYTFIDALNKARKQENGFKKLQNYLKDFVEK